MRNQDKVIARNTMSIDDVAELEKRYMIKYQNPVGPDANWLFKNKQKELLKKGIEASDDKIWDLVIENSMKNDDVVNTLLGIKH